MRILIGGNLASKEASMRMASERAGDFTSKVRWLGLLGILGLLAIIEAPFGGFGAFAAFWFWRHPDPFWRRWAYLGFLGFLGLLGIAALLS